MAYFYIATNTHKKERATRPPTVILGVAFDKDSAAAAGVVLAREALAAGATEGLITIGELPRYPSALGAKPVSGWRRLSPPVPWRYGPYHTHYTADPATWISNYNSGKVPFGVSREGQAHGIK